MCNRKLQTQSEDFERHEHIPCSKKDIYNMGIRIPCLDNYWTDYHSNWLKYFPLKIYRNNRGDPFMFLQAPLSGLFIFNLSSTLVCDQICTKVATFQLASAVVCVVQIS